MHNYNIHYNYISNYLDLLGFGLSWHLAKTVLLAEWYDW